MNNNEKLISREFKEKILKSGVVCVLIIDDEGEDKVVLTSLPPEDTERKKSEYNAWSTDRKPTILTNNMWCIPGGGINPSDKTSDHALEREIKEELGISIERSRLCDLPVHSIIKQEKTKENEDAEIEESTYIVYKYTYKLTLDEFEKLKTKMKKQNRKIIKLSLKEVKQLDKSEIRPTSLDAVLSYFHHLSYLSEENTEAYDNLT